MTVDLGVLVEEADYTAYLAGDVDSTLTAAQDAVRAYCGWHIAPEVAMDVRVPSWRRDKIILPTLHLVSVEDVTLEDGTVEDLATMEAHVEGFLTRPATGWRYYPFEFPQYATVSMTHGFEEPPTDVQRVILALAARWVNSAPDGGLVANSRQVGQVSVGYSVTSTRSEGTFLASETAILDHYRIVSVE